LCARDHAVLRQLGEKKRFRPTRWNGVQHRGQTIVLVIVAVSSCGGFSVVITGRFAHVLCVGVVGSQPVAVTVEVHDNGAV